MTPSSGISVTFNPGIDEVISRIRSLPPEYQAQVLEGVEKYALEVLAEYPKQKSVTRRKAYPETGDGFFSDRQRRWFFAALNSGDLKIPYPRTGELGRSWKAVKTEDEVRLTNDASGAGWVMGENQSRHEGLVGWKKATAIIAGALTFRSSKFRAMVQKAYQNAIRKLKFGE